MHARSVCLVGRWIVQWVSLQISLPVCMLQTVVSATLFAAMGFESSQWSAGLLAEGLEGSILRVAAVRADKLGGYLGLELEGLKQGASSASTLETPRVWAAWVSGLRSWVL